MVDVSSKVLATAAIYESVVARLEEVLAAHCISSLPAEDRAEVLYDKASSLYSLEAEEPKPGPRAASLEPALDVLVFFGQRHSSQL